MSDWGQWERGSHKCALSDIYTGIQTMLMLTLCPQSPHRLLYSQLQSYTL